MLEAGFYSIITHDVLYDENLTSNEKLLYATITGLTKQKGYCYASNDYLAEKMNTSKRSISRWLNNLEKKGYINRNLTYKEDSKEVEERQIYTLLSGGVRNDMGSRQKSHEPHDRNGNTPHVTNGIENSELINSQSNSEVDNKDHFSDKELEERFEKIWKEYPRKKGKAAALKHYKKHIKNGDFTDEVISQKIDEYKKEIEFKKTGTDFIKHGSTFFNNGWQDEFEYKDKEKSGGYDTSEYEGLF